ncbi:alpha/beta fold hydrolase [Streptomyces sp. NPDC096311]|uniref:alpha/beta fold hydrolase n=1 Tax=Streptomyces sp. NPDC096311 TaxID=3366083 RepID=UPI0037F8FABC
MTSCISASRPPRRRIRGTVAVLLSAAALAASPPTVAAGRPAGPRQRRPLCRRQTDRGAGARGVRRRLPLEHGRRAPAVLRRVRGLLVLVGHSYGGAVISQATMGNPGVKALVHVCAFMPGKGEALGQLAARFPGGALNPALKQVPFRNMDGTTGTDLFLAPDKFHAVFAADVPRTTTSVMAATPRPIAASAFNDKATSAAWRTIPSWAAAATHDKATAPDTERFEAAEPLPTSSHTRPSMARTGFPTLGLAGAAGAMLIAGAGLVTLGRKRPNRAY